PDPRPLLYLDVDGVLNPEHPAPGLTEHTVGALTIRVHPAHAAWLAELAPHYDLTWATTWEEHANEHIAPLLGLPPLPYVAFREYETRPDDPYCPPLRIPQMYKWVPILRHANGRRFAWVDDVIPFRARRQALPHRSIRLLRTDPATGLTRRHVNRLLHWARS
ncbi:HAD domain-containing protein, partial [Actinomadura kijaniata]|uniref:HAD domain-containing protein n=1 Tax=Actinomadura kijaniata TaxID=46161 RepID=UPI003F192DAE